MSLSSYYLLLNGGVLAIAWFRSWRILNLVGFGFTFVIGSLWGYQFYRPEFFASTEPFLVAFFFFIPQLLCCLHYGSHRTLRALSMEPWYLEYLW